MDYLDENVKEITVNIYDSPGGSVDHGYLIYALLKNCGAKIITNGIGLVGSAATYPFMAGDPDSRNVTESVKWYIHKPSVKIEGTADELVGKAEKAAKYLKVLENSIINLNTENSNQSRDFIKELIYGKEGDGSFLTAKQMIEYGIASNIIKNKIILNEMDWKKLALDIVKFYQGIEISEEEIDNLSNFGEFQNLFVERGGDMYNLLNSFNSAINKKTVVCNKCKNEFDITEMKPDENGKVKCPKCDTMVDCMKPKAENKLITCGRCGNGFDNNNRNPDENSKITCCYCGAVINSEDGSYSEERTFFQSIYNKFFKPKKIIINPETVEALNHAEDKIQEITNEKTEIQNQIALKDTEIINLKTDHEGKITAKETEITNLKTSHETVINQLKSEHNTAITNLTTERDEFKTKFDTVTNEFTTFKGNTHSSGNPPTESVRYKNRPLINMKKEGEAMKNEPIYELQEQRERRKEALKNKTKPV
jgi:ATP-dependent protease ClpP protease subunit